MEMDKEALGNAGTIIRLNQSDIQTKSWTLRVSFQRKTSV